MNATQQIERLTARLQALWDSKELTHGLYQNIEREAREYLSSTFTEGTESHKSAREAYKAICKFSHRTHPQYAEIRSLLHKLEASGAKLVAVNDGEERIPTSTRDEASEAILSVDESWLYVRYPEDEKNQTLYLILGNEPGYVVCDYSACKVLDKVTTEHSNQWDK
jgi:hypothetical protein